MKRKRLKINQTKHVRCIFTTFALALLLILLTFPNMQESVFSDSERYTYIILLSPFGTYAQSLQFIDQLANLGMPVKNAYAFQQLGDGAILNLTQQDASIINRTFHPFIIFQSKSIYLQQISSAQTFNQSWSYFPGGPYTGRNVTVAVIDTGVDSSLPALAGRVVGGYNLVDNNNNFTDIDGHGTAVASIIAGNSSFFHGVAPEAKILAYKIFSLNETTSALVVEAMDRAAKDGANIINLSLGGELNSEMLWKLGYALEQKGIALVAAAGNDGPSLQTISSPGNLPPYLSVGATTSNFSNAPIALLRVDGYLWLESALPMLASPVTNGIITAKYVFVGSATPQEVKNLDLKGKIAVSLRDRKTTFTQMDYDVANAGAVALVVINDVNTSLQGLLFSNVTTRVPAVAISSSDGEKLDLMQGNNSYLQMQVFIPNNTYPAFFSSRGPVNPFTMKPEILAPGDMVPALTPSGRYLLSGTSFSTPQVAGAIALLMQEHPSLKPVQYYSMLTLSAESLQRWNQSYPSYIAGAGEMNITKALDMQFALQNQDFDVVYPFSEGYYNDTMHFLFFSSGINYKLAYRGDFKLFFNQSYISADHPALQVSVPWFSSENLSSLPFYDSSITISGDGEDYHLPVIAVPNQVGIYFNYTDLSLFVLSQSWKDAEGNITSPDGTIYPLTIVKNAPTQLFLPDIIPGYYYVDIIFNFDAGNYTSYLSFYLTPSNNAGFESFYYPYSAFYSIVAYSLFLIAISVTLALYKRLQRVKGNSF